MGDRRMFSNRIVNSAKFLKMPLSTQALYFHLGMRADDDGICEAFPIMRMTGAMEDDLRILISKGFVTILNEDLICYISDWNENNTIRSDRKIDSIYQDLLIKVIPDAPIKRKAKRADTGKFTGEKALNLTIVKEENENWTSNGQPMDRISKDKLSKDNISKDNLHYLTSEASTEKPEQKNDNPSNAPEEHSMEEPIEEVFVSFPLLGGKTVGITKKWCDEMQAIYGLGGVNVRYEILRAKKWCEDNSRYKTKWKQFLSNWFEKSVSHGGSGVPLDAFNEQNGEIIQKSNQNATATQEKSERDMFNELVSSMKKNIQEIN